MDLAHRAVRIEQHVQHRLDHHRIEAAVGELDRVRVGDELHVTRRKDVERGDPYARAVAGACHGDRSAP